MAIEISMAVQLPETTEVEIPVTVESCTRPYPSIIRTESVDGATRTEDLNEDGTLSRVYWKNTDGDTVRLDIYKYTDSYIIVTRIVAGKTLTIRTTRATGYTEIIEDMPEYSFTLEVARDIIRASPNVRSLPVGTEVSIPWESEDGKEYDNVLVLVDYQYMTVEEEPDGDPVWVGIFRSKYAALHPMQYDAPERERRTETTALNGYKYYRINQTISSGHVIAESAAAASTSAGGTIPSAYVYKYSSSRLSGPVTTGCARYGVSAAHKYLNSDADVGAWWSKSNIGDVAPLNADETRGYLAGFAAGDLALIRSVKVSWLEPSTSDSSADQTAREEYCRFWLPSATELYCPSTTTDEGAAWEEYWQAKGCAEPVTGTAARKIFRMDKNEEAVSYWTRSSDSISSQHYILNSGVKAHGGPGRGQVTKKSGRTTYIEIENIERYLVPVCAVG